MKRLLILCTTLLLLCGCRSHQQYAYIADAPRNQQMPITNTFATTIAPDDQLYINVYSQTAEAARPFNEERNSLAPAAQGQGPQGYLVSQTGYIMFPVLGRIRAAGLTTDSLERLIAHKLVEGQYVNDPIVTVSLMNFSVTVIGEVKTPSQVFAPDNRLTIFEAIAQCGDVTMDGIRSCITIVRSRGENVVVDTVDLTSRLILDSPFYYLQPNDVIYVEPTRKKKRMAYRNEDWPIYMSTGVSALRLAYTAIYNYAVNPIYKRYK